MPKSFFNCAPVTTQSLRSGNPDKKNEFEKPNRVFFRINRSQYCTQRCKISCLPVKTEYYLEIKILFNIVIRVQLNKCMIEFIKTIM